MEVDYLPGHEGWIKELTVRHPWDYLIGSVHYISESWDIDNPKKISEWKKRDPYEVWSIYFDRLTQAADSRLFEILGHADLPKKFCFYPEQDCTELYRKFLRTAHRTETALELNTAGLRKDCREIYPSQSIVNLAYEEKDMITFGSDAHAPQDVGMNFEEAAASARQAGYSQSCRFTGRKRQMVSF